MRWYGQKTENIDATLSSLSEFVPDFSRHQFGVNQYLDVIVREPFDEDAREIPLASVSRKYQLIKHEEVIKWLIGGISGAGFDPDSLFAEMRISEYGERISIKVNLDGPVIDPGDGFGVSPAIEVTNSVDKTTALEISIPIIRLICTNGLYVSENQVLRIIHHKDWMKKTDVRAFIEQQLNLFTRNVQILSKWLDIALTPAGLITWIDNELPKRWGVVNAARFYSIITTGFDGEVTKNTLHYPPTKRFVSKETKVPGSDAPVTNAYHAYQALAWVASNANSIENIRKMQRELISIFESLNTHMMPTRASDT